jgi:hypothetical protein
MMDGGPWSTAMSTRQTVYWTYSVLEQQSIEVNSMRIGDNGTGRGRGEAVIRRSGAEKVAESRKVRVAGARDHDRGI